MNGPLWGLTELGAIITRVDSSPSRISLILLNIFWFKKGQSVEKQMYMPSYMNIPTAFPQRIDRNLWKGFSIIFSEKCSRKNLLPNGDFSHFLNRQMIP
jgi:hypothetical protein